MCNTDNYLINNSATSCFTALLAQHIKFRYHDKYALTKLS